MTEDVITAVVALELAKARGRAKATPADHKEAKNLVRAFGRDEIGIIVSEWGLVFVGMPDDLDDEGKLAVWLALGQMDPATPITLGPMPEAPIPFPQRATGILYPLVVRWTRPREIEPPRSRHSHERHALGI